MFSGSTHQLPYIRDYAEARAQWDKSFKTRSAKWNQFQRPLRNIAQRHYRLESTNPDKFIDVLLYSTIMARYYAPDANGHERRLYMGDSSITSKKFMWDVLGHSGADNWSFNTNGERIAAPIYNRWFFIDTDGAKFSADFCFIAPGHIDTEKSRHTKHWKVVSTPADLAHRAKVREVWAPYLDLMMYRLPEFEAEAELNYAMGRPFSGSHIAWENTTALQKMNAVLLEGCMPHEGQIDALVRLSQTMFNGLASKRGYAQGNFNLKPSWWGKNANDGYAKLDKPITAHDLRKSVHNKLEQIVNAKVRSGYYELPQFVTEEAMPGGTRIVGESDPSK
ncbi:MAG: hypothetical protein EBW87_02065 [Burkholderiaceae bacterium]|nr:hypothetical protein [Burkholderiaceae bacterium]